MGRLIAPRRNYRLRPLRDAGLRAARRAGRFALLAARLGLGLRFSFIFGFGFGFGLVFAFGLAFARRDDFLARATGGADFVAAGSVAMPRS